MSSNPPLAASAGLVVAIAVGAVAAIYYGVVPWALHAVITATLWIFGYR
jgi:hypothetical protein